MSLPQFDFQHQNQQTRYQDENAHHLRDRLHLRRTVVAHAVQLNEMRILEMDHFPRMWIAEELKSDYDNSRFVDSNRSRSLP